ncbi:MAG TPA: SDR family NAD(P)-dependent oxidoreductase [Acidobacteriaceae bacterium]|jgi:malonyl CoA-acyl carrier protein transacylase|nr:SDR family NAD(P)-dependent oxidoreductase [Acidobacteriaceae bacterium]
MDDFRARIEKLSPKRLALLALELQERLAQLEEQQKEPIAIIGMGCRVPGGGNGLEEFWRILAEGRDVIREIPPERWDAAAYYDADPDAPGRMATRWGGFLEDVTGFDAAFFGISRREANSMDPQQRLLLEVSWEALENAGYCPRKAAGGSVGVFTGITTTDYHSLMLERGEESITVHMATGSGNNIAGGRISYVLALQGPNVSVDTACSSSLVAIHLACQSLRAGESRMALAAGVNALLAPELFIALSKAHALASDGRCKAFDARSDGFARAEGCGVVVLKRLSHAVADGDNILALIRGSAVNQDGRSSGMTAPNGAAQEAVIRQALASAGLQPQEVDYVEAHGTGTVLGDPIEAHALAASLGVDRGPEHPLVLGSVKTNLGHLEAAAGVIGLIKIVLSMQNGSIPQHLHFESLNPHIDWNGRHLQVAGQAKPWPRSERPRIAGLNSFGLSGTNSHILLQEAPLGEKKIPAVERPLHLLALSARSESALEGLRQRYAEYLASSHEPLGNICFTAGSGRAHFEQRAAFVASDRDAMRAALEAAPAAAGLSHESPPVVFLFPGQGAQYHGMARQLYEGQPVFRKELDACAELLGASMQAPLLEVLWGSDPALINQTAYTQPALFAVEYALARLWMNWGVEPAAVAGHSIGEYVAACIAGVYSLEDGLKLVAARARLMQSVGGTGGMAAVMAGEERVRQALSGVEDRVTIAALNAPNSTVISGYQPEMGRVQEALERDGIRVLPLTVSHAFHSPQMREMEAAFEEVAASLRFQNPRLRLISSVTGREIGDELCHPAYWRRQIVQPVRYRDLVRTLEQSGYRTFLEVGPGTTLAALGRQCIADGDTSWLPSLRKSRDDWRQMLDSLAHLYALGVLPDWAGFEEPYERVRVPLPTYPFEREQYWFEERGRTQRVPGGKTRAGESLDDWFYKMTWVERDGPRAPVLASSRWLIVPDRKGVATALAEQLRQSGAAVTLARSSDELSSLLRDPFDFVLHAAPLDHDTPAELDDASLTAGRTVLMGAIATARALLSAANRGRLWIATRGAQPVLAGGDGTNAIHAQLWGLGRTFGQENPDSWGGLVDLDPAATVEEMASALISSIGCSGREDEIAFRAGRTYVARMVRHKDSSDGSWKPAADRTVLITGGAGGLGLQICSWMAEHGARHLVLTGRRSPSAEAEAVLAGLRERGVAVEFRAVDVTNKSQLEALFAEFGRELPPLGGVVHAAGVLDDSVFANLTEERVSKVLAPKFEGAWNLHQVTASLSLDFFVFFSSLAAVTGSPGQGAYSAANGFLDGLARYRVAHGLPALSLNWGAWAGTGMAGRVDKGARPQTGPFRQMRSDKAIAAFGRLLRSSAIEIAVADIDWEELARTTGGQDVRPVFSLVLGAKAKPNAGSGALGGLGVLPMESLRPQLIAFLRGSLATILGIDEAAVVATRSLVDIGVDSLMALEFRNRIRSELQVSVATAKLLAGPTLEDLANEFAGQISPKGASDITRLSADAMRPQLIRYLTRSLAKILGVEESAIVPTRSLVDLGLDSLMALEFRNQIRTDLHVSIATSKLLAGPTLEVLTDEIAAQVSGTTDGRSEETKAPSDREYPLSYGQQSQWFGHKLIPGSSTFNVGFTASVSPCLDWKRFHRATARLVERHPALRTTIVEVEPGRPVQRVIAWAEPDLELIDASGWTEAELKDRTLEEFKREFAIEHAMMRIRVFRTERDRDIILFAVDHLIADASSLIICFEDLREYYGGEFRNGEPTLEPLGADYGDFVKWESTLAEGPESERLWGYWRRKLGGNLPVLSLPSSRPRPDVLLPNGQSVGLSFAPELAAAVRQLAREKRATTYSVLLAAYFILLKMYCQQDDFVVGTSVSQRDEGSWSRVVGFFVNILPLRADLSGDLTFTDHLSRVREVVLSGLAHHEFPFPILVNRLAQPRTLRHSPVFQAFLNFLQDRAGDFGGLVTPGGDTAISFGPSTLRPFIVIPQEDGRSEIALHIGQNEDQLAGNLNYNGDVLDRATAEAMAASYLQILERVVADPGRPIGEIIFQAGQPQNREEILL